MNKNIFIVINNHGLSGTEKRTLAIYKKLTEINKNIFLILSKENFQSLLEINEFDINKINKDNVIILNPKKNNYISYFISLISIRKKINNNSIIHFPLIYSPLFFFFKKINLIISWNSNYKPILNKKINFFLLIMIWYSFLKSYKIDVLNESNYIFLKKFNLISKKINLNSGGSFTDFDKLKPSIKANNIVLLSRFTEGKGIIEFIDSIETFDELLISYNIKNVEIHICGSGELKSVIFEKVNKIILKSIKLNIYYNKKPEILLSKSKIFISLQERSNYPSKSLIEAMAAGCVPIIRNSGDSFKMIDKKLGIFINENFDDNELSHAMLNILKMESKEFEKKSYEIRNQTIKKFNINKSINYYSKLYNIA
jgi:glycosyltransferase involved in cell wall biosynthesis